MTANDDPLLLAFDTATEVGSVGLGRGEDIVAYGLLLEEREHAAALVGQIAAVLDDGGVDRRDVAGIVVGRGPGSFTGLRVAAATAKGLSRGLGVPLWHYSSLAAAAASYDAPISIPNPPGDRVSPVSVDGDAGRWCRYVLFDARSERVYAACYRFGPDRLETVVEPSATTVAEVLESDVPDDVVFCGSGAIRHAGAIEAAGFPVVPLPAGVPTPHGLLRLHRLHPGRPPVPAGSRWEPEYLRGSSARRPAMAADWTR